MSAMYRETLSTCFTDVLKFAMELYFKTGEVPLIVTYRHLQCKLICCMRCIVLSFFHCALFKYGASFMYTC